MTSGWALRSQLVEGEQGTTVGSQLRDGVEELQSVKDGKEDIGVALMVDVVESLMLLV